MSDTVNKPYKLSVRVGGHEFNGEGDEASVRADYATFIAAIRSTIRPAADAWQDAVDAYLLAAPKPASRLTRLLADLTFTQEHGLTMEEAEALFGVDMNATDTVTLKHLPITTDVVADGLLLLLLGYDVLLGRKQVEASELFLAGHLSKLGFERLDRAISPYKQLLEVEGATRGTRYSLNVQGQAQAIRIAREILKYIEKKRPSR